jgi:hypothetical protein
VKREHIDFVVDGYARMVLHHAERAGFEAPGSPSATRPKVGDITLGTLKQMRLDVRQSSDVLDAFLESWIRARIDRRELDVHTATGHFIRKLNALGERFFVTRNRMNPTDTWRWFSPADWEDAAMRLHDVARSFPKVTFRVDQSGRVKQQ